jgi:galactose-1-phosphate uridylyltransferase
MGPLDFHLYAVDELLRVAEEVRICLPDLSTVQQDAFAFLCRYVLCRFSDDFQCSYNSILLFTSMKSSNEQSLTKSSAAPMALYISCT